MISFTNYIKECLYGVRGIVSDSVTGAPLKSKIYVTQYTDTNWIYSDSVCGDYHRMLSTGTYTLRVTAPGYITKTVANVYAKYDSTTYLNIKLRPIGTPILTENNTPAEYSLKQNYPNPFNPVTKIEFSLKENSYVKISLFNVLGKEIAVLSEGNQNRGTHFINFDAGKYSLTSGVYFYKLTAGTYSEVKSMMLLK